MTIPNERPIPRGHGGRAQERRDSLNNLVSPLYNQYYQDTYKPAGISRWNWQKFQDSRMRWIRTYARIGRMDLSILAFIEWSNAGGYIRKGYGAKT